ncbi:MAG: mandelate racemase/muconate lactonizing enzyme family protein [Pirellulaceae bacterium]
MKEPYSMFNRRRMLQTGAALVAGGSLCLEEMLQAQQARANPVKITAVKTYLLKTELKRAFGVSISVPLDKTRSTLLVKIETDAGIVGWGETAPIMGTRGAIVDHLSGRLVGQNPLRYRHLLRQLWGRVFHDALAVGALEMALNDVRGKLLGKPVAELFGGRLRDKVPVYASAMNYLEGAEPEDHYPEEAVALVKQGYQALKMRLGRYSVRRESKIAASVREAVGPGIRLMADGNAAYSIKPALAMGDALHELDFDFWEEPLPQDPDYAAYDVLREKLRIPLAGGEVIPDRTTARRLLDRGAFDIIQPDISLCGGISEVLFIAELAALSQVQIVPHCWGGAILIAGTIHLLSLLPDPHWGFPTDTPLLELDRSENPWRTEITDRAFEVDSDGFIAVPTRPGLGIEVDEKRVKKYQVG